jgi:hypothetical protein
MKNAHFVPGRPTSFSVDGATLLLRFSYQRKSFAVRDSYCEGGLGKQGGSGVHRLNSDSFQLWDMQVKLRKDNATEDIGHR